MLMLKHIGNNSDQRFLQTNKSCGTAYTWDFKDITICFKVYIKFLCFPYIISLLSKILTFQLKKMLWVLKRSFLLIGALDKSSLAEEVRCLSPLTFEFLLIQTKFNLFIIVVSFTKPIWLLLCWHWFGEKAIGKTPWQLPGKLSTSTNSILQAQV